MLDRHLLFKRLPPDVRETDLRLLAESDVVDLFDRLLIKKLNKSPDERLQQPEFFELHRRNETKRIVPDRTFHFGFVGDSRVRQLFALIYQVSTDKLSLERNGNTFAY